ncbi:MAG TPA: MFS transporter [Patescibacteria group bacterium]
MFKKVPFKVFILGLVSLFNDAASEMIYPIIPIFLTTVLHAPVAIVGLIDGIAEGAASLFKFVFGYVSDRMQKRKIFVIAGYGASALSKPIIALATVWPVVLVAQILNRLGKGLRTSARDALLLQNTTLHNKGYIFGFHRALDSAGAVFGPLLALFFINTLHENLRAVFFFAFIPGLLSILLLIIFIQDKKQELMQKKIKISFAWGKINGRLKLFFLVSIIFALGNSTNSFLILRAHDLGLTTTLTILVYVFYNLTYSLFSTPAGHISDKIGARKVYALGLLIFALVYFLFASINNSFWIWLLFPIYGLYIAFTDGVSKAYIAEFITESESGTYFGLYEAGISVAIFLASFIGGLLWTIYSPAVTFYYGALMAILAFVVLVYGKIFRKL